MNSLTATFFVCQISTRSFRTDSKTRDQSVVYLLTKQCDDTAITLLWLAEPTLVDSLCLLLVYNQQAVYTETFACAGWKIIVLLVLILDPSPVDINQKNCLHIAFHRSCPGDVVTEILKKFVGFL